jgi:predicted house-cleaning noncanonical NTP pyrophosphatase (MazG superfamily)
MPSYEFCNNMDQEMIANKLRNLKNEELAVLVESVLIMITCGHFPQEAFHEVRSVQKLLLNLKVSAQEDETYN